MKTDFSVFIKKAVQAYTLEKENEVQQAKLNAFLCRRRMLHAQEHEDRGSICDMYPSIPVEGIERISATLGAVTITNLDRCVSEMIETDPAITAAFFRWKASQRRVSRTSGMNAVTAVRRAVATTGARAVVAGDFARHKDTVESLTFVLDTNNESVVDSSMSAIEELCQTKVTAVSRSEYRFSVKVGNRSILCSIHTVAQEDLCAAVVWHTGPEHFIKKVNAKLARFGFELTSRGMRNQEDGKSVWCATETSFWEIMGVPTPPTSARDMIDDVLCDTAGIILCDTHTVDTGIMFRDGGIPENMKSNLESGMRDISLGGLVVAGTRDIRHTKNEIEKARLTAAINTTTPVGLLITSNSLPSLELADLADYIVVEDDELQGLYLSALPAATKVHKKVIVRNPLMYINSMCMLDGTITKDEALRKIEMMGAVIEITGGLCYEGIPTEAIQDIGRTKCKITLGSACDPWSMTQGIYTARVRCCKALIQQSRVMSDQDFLNWLE